jgi:hypothetical protein
MRQQGLIQNTDGPAVRLQPDAARRFAIDLHAQQLDRFGKRAKSSDQPSPQKRPEIRRFPAAIAA